MLLQTLLRGAAAAAGARRTDALAAAPSPPLPADTRCSRPTFFFVAEVRTPASTIIGIAELLEGEAASAAAAFDASGGEEGSAGSDAIVVTAAKRILSTVAEHLEIVSDSAAQILTLVRVLRVITACLRALASLSAWFLSLLLRVWRYRLGCCIMCSHLLGDSRRRVPCQYQFNSSAWRCSFHPSILPRPAMQIDDALGTGRQSQVATGHHDAAPAGKGGGQHDFHLTLKRVRLSRLLDKSWACCRMQKRYKDKVGQLRLEMRVSPQLASAEVMVDPVRAFQILTNCVGNSIKFTPEGGSVRRCPAAGKRLGRRACASCRCGCDLRCCCRPAAQAQRSRPGSNRARSLLAAVHFLPTFSGELAPVSVSLQVTLVAEPCGDASPFARIRVVDTGIGLSPAGRKRLFRPFGQVRGAPALTPAPPGCCEE